MLFEVKLIDSTVGFGLVCNFVGSPNSSVTRLNDWEVEILSHEFGNALHSLFSRMVWCCSVNWKGTNLLPCSWSLLLFLFTCRIISTFQGTFRSIRVSHLTISTPWFINRWMNDLLCVGFPYKICITSSFWSSEEKGYNYDWVLLS